MIEIKDKSGQVIGVIDDEGEFTMDPNYTPLASTLEELAEEGQNNANNYNDN